MPLTGGTRKALTRAVERCRKELEDEVLDQLERLYGFSRDGAPRAVAELQLTRDQNMVAEQLREWHRHLLGLFSGTTAERQKAAYRRMAEETAFTVLHRLAALRMAEERKVVLPCVRAGVSSDGFRLFERLAGGALGTTEEAYRVYLDRVFDDVAQDLPALFDRREPRSLVFPRPQPLEKVVASLTAPALDDAWHDDETIGWVYQDFHSPKERQQLRKGKDVPENAYELAVRNQLFTPRWVVEFLTDNTLGRYWYDALRGETALADRCGYLFRGEALREVPRKDPRDIRVLDPACGSGHFLLYAYDLMEAIYLESWERHAGQNAERKPLWVEYPERRQLERALPALILRHNLFGVDIDLRAIQVAALALWLRAQKGWKDRGIAAGERPAIRRMNLVVAEPMPGDRALLEEFLAGVQPVLLGKLTRRVWEAMRPVGETGVLLRIDQMIRQLVREARQDWTDTLEGLEQLELEEALPNWPGRRHELAGLARDEAARFWADAEDRVVEALEAYAAQAADSERVLRRLFAEDAERGFAFVDLSRTRFDAVLMNPPFGQPAAGTKEALDQAYPACGHEIYAMFFQRALELLEGHGRVGAITNRTWLANKWLRGLREEVFGRLGAVVLGADLGYGVLEAKVETAAIVVDRRATPDTVASWIRLVTTGSKQTALGLVLDAMHDGTEPRFVHRASAGRYRRLPDGAYAYWFSDALQLQHVSAHKLSHYADIKQGISSAGDFRCLRLAWEVSAREISLSCKWPRFAKGGEHRPFWDDVHLVLNISDDCAEMRAAGAALRNTKWFGRRGVTWPRRTNLPFGPRVFAEALAFGDKGPTIFPRALNAAAALAVASSRPFYLALSPWLNTADWSPKAISKSYEVGTVKDRPWPELDGDAVDLAERYARRASELVRTAQLEDDSTAETCVAWILPPVHLTGRHLDLPTAARRRVEAREDRFAELSDLTAEIDDLVADAYGFTERDRRLMDEELEPAVARFPADAPDPDPDIFRTAYLTKSALPGGRLPGGLDAEVDVRVEHRRGKQTRSLRDEESLCRLFALPPRRLAEVRRRLDLLRDEDLRRCAADIVSWAVGVAFGRWDVRLLDDPTLIPGWADSWAPLPRCPVGQLVDARGLPATREHIASVEWLRARTDACVLPKLESGAETAEYPLPVAWEGILQDDVVDSRHPDDLYLRVASVLEHIYGAAHQRREAELADALGVDSLLTWLRKATSKPNGGFFDDHLSRYSKSSRTAPIYWPLSTASGGLTFWIYYPRLRAETLATLVNRLDTGDDALKRAEDRLEAARRAGTGPSDTQDQLDRLADERRERTVLRNRLKALVDRGFKPHLDDGAVLNAGPLRECFLNAKWRAKVDEHWAEVQRGEHDWSHLAMWLRREEVLKKCATQEDIAIAHGRRDLYVTTPKKKRGTRRADQLRLPSAGEEDDG